MAGCFTPGLFCIFYSLALQFRNDYPLKLMFELEVKNVSKWFGTRKIFENINLDLKSGQSIAVAGPNGSGKTTLLRIIIGLTVPTAGEVVFSQENKKLDFDSYRSSLSLVGPYLSLYGSLTARENLKFISKVSGTLSSDSDIGEMLEKVGLDGRGDDYVLEFSSGMQQRLKYAAALIKNPSILILDEPTSNLDDEGKKRVFNIINQYRPDSIIIIATNEKEEYSLADSVCQLGE
ncbi:MAG: ABC transporter ATP-binding protein [Candidatus Zixiibacteriota bacterium]|nr:MAG: ABC transporter ATP-binding protein [candidate division Zixibacteria bacterium]